MSLGRIPLARKAVQFTQALGLVIAVATGGGAWADDQAGGVPAVGLALPPIPNPNAEAKTPAEMKAYTETLPGTEVTFDMVAIPGASSNWGAPRARRAATPTKARSSN